MVRPNSFKPKPLPRLGSTQALGLMTHIARIFLAATLGLGSTVHAQLVALPEADQPTIGYKTVAEALAALRAKPGVDMRVQGGWTIATEREANVLWSFAPQGHPAYPAAVKRHTYEKDDTAYIGMDVLCEASKTACDKLVREFQELNARIRESMQQKAQLDAPADVPASRPRS